MWQPSSQSPLVFKAKLQHHLSSCKHINCKQLSATAQQDLLRTHISIDSNCNCPTPFVKTLAQAQVAQVSSTLAQAQVSSTQARLDITFVKHLRMRIYVYTLYADGTRIPKHVATIIPKSTRIHSKATKPFRQLQTLQLTTTATA